MFLLEVLLLISLIYWISACIANTLLVSKEECQLSPAIRVGFGFFISIAFFSGAWLVMSVWQAWLFGLILLICHVKSFSGVAGCKRFIRVHIKGFLALLAAAVLFFYH